MELHTDFRIINSSNPKDHIQLVEKYLTELKHFCQEEIKSLKDPKAQVLLETTAEVIGGLEKAYSDYQAENEGVWINNPDRPTLM